MSVSSARIWFCGTQSVEKIDYLSVEVRYTEKHPIEDLRCMNPTYIKLDKEGDQPYCSYTLFCNAAAAVDGVAYVIVSDGDGPYIQGVYASVGTKDLGFSPRRRVNLEADSLDGKIYIYGIDADERPIFEVFDPANGNIDNIPWYCSVDPLTFAGFDTDIMRVLYSNNYVRLLGVDADDKRIVFIGHNGFFCYDTQNGRWESETGNHIQQWLLESLFESSDCRRCVVVGKRIYWLADTKQMMAYHLGECATAHYESKELAKFQGTFCRFSADNEFNVRRARLLHINENYFCLVWQSVFSSHVLVTTLRVSSSTTKRCLTVSLLNTQKYEIDGYNLGMRLALLLQPRETLSTCDTMEDLEEFAESPAPPDLFDVPYSIVRYLSPEGDRFVSKHPLSFWICGYTNEVDCFFPIVLRVRGAAESSKVKRNRREETALEPKYIETGGLKGCVHVNLGDKIYNLGGSACPNTRARARAAEDCIKVIDIYDTSKVVDECRMNKARYGPQVAVVGKKIYIFGGDDAEFRDGKSLKSAEFFDVDQRQSHPLHDGFESDFRLVGVYNNHKIMFLPGKGRWSDTNSGGYLTRYYCYDTLENVWLTETGTKLNFMSKGIGYFNHVLVGTTLYWVSEHGFNCYDFKTFKLGGNCFQDNFDISFHGNFNFDSEVSMFHMHKNVFCVIISRYEKIFWMAVSISMSNTVILRFGFYKLDVKVLHVDLYTIPDGSFCREVTALRV